MRTEFGAPRTSCDCPGCQMNCRFMPGFLIPAERFRRRYDAAQTPRQRVKAAVARLNYLIETGN